MLSGKLNGVSIGADLFFVKWDAKAPQEVQSGPFKAAMVVVFPWPGTTLVSPGRAESFFKESLISSLEPPGKEQFPHER